MSRPQQRLGPRALCRRSQLVLGNQVTLAFEKYLPSTWLRNQKNAESKSRGFRDPEKTKSLFRQNLGPNHDRHRVCADTSHAEKTSSRLPKELRLLLVGVRKEQQLQEPEILRSELMSRLLLASKGSAPFGSWRMKLESRVRLEINSTWRSHQTSVFLRF